MPKTVLGETFYDTNDIAKMIGVTQNTVRLYYQRGLKFSKWGAANRAYTTRTNLLAFLSGDVTRPNNEAETTEEDNAEQGDE